jgi:hypothetical protein
MASNDVTQGRRGAVASFLDEVRRLPAHSGVGAGSRGRLIFALDATASRERAWDQACDVQAAMFVEAERLGGLDVQLAYYRGFGECRASRWVASPSELIRLMQAVRCVSGRTQIGRILRHAANETARERVHALVFVGDAVEEDVDALGHLAGELGLRGVRAFLFHEGHEPAAARAFGHVAKLTGGACCRFDAGSPAQLRELLRAVAAYAAGGAPALQDLARRDREGGPVRLIARQVG